MQPSSGAWGIGTPYQGLKKSGKAAKIEGKVLSMRDLTPYEGMEPGYELKVDTGGGKEVDVHLGPRWFLLQNDVNLTKGAPIVVVGVTVRFEGEPTLLANEIVQGDKRIILNDTGGSGTPANGKH